MRVKLVKPEPPPEEIVITLTKDEAGQLMRALSFTSYTLSSFLMKDLRMLGIEQPS
jgi:hypothetical protein